MIGDINQLPEECLANVISFTSPRDACVISAVSPAFRSVADSDATWQRFLPSDLTSILSRAAEPVELVQYPSKKALFLRLCDHPMLIDGGKMSFILDRSSGAKCFMISARAMSIVWSFLYERERCSKWVRLPDSRFSEGAELLGECWKAIGGKIESKILSPHTTYTAHVIYKLGERVHCANSLQEAIINVGGQRVSRRLLRVHIVDDRWLKKREDGWMESMIGEFYNENGDDGEVEMRFKDVMTGPWRYGVILQGIEIRPKN